jgi:predicted ATPase
MHEYERLDEQGDGIRSFVGISLALLILKRSLFLIDEPEAFLHPPQAFRIGAFIGEQAKQSRQIIIATHSVDVLRGILSRSQDVDIVRIDRVGNRNSGMVQNHDPLALHLLTTDDGRPPVVRR